MATFTWYGYCGSGPSWTDVSTDTIVFSGSSTDLTEPVTVGSWQDGTHLGDGDPGDDQCGANHMNNVKYVSGTQFDDGGGTETLNDTNLTDAQTSIRVGFTHSSAVAISNARFYTFDGSTETTEAVGVEAYAFEQGVGATSWTEVNDDSDNAGGDNSGERLSLSDQTSGTEHFFYIAISARPESVGAKTEFDFGIALTYS